MRHATYESRTIRRTAIFFRDDEQATSGILDTPQKRQSEQQATKRLLGLSVSQKNELLYHYGINFNDLPNWQKRGVGLFWEEYDKPSVNPVTKEMVTARRRRIRTDFDLPMKDDYCQFLRSIISQAQTQGA